MQIWRSVAFVMLTPELPPHVGSILLKHRVLEELTDTYSAYDRVQAMLLLLEDRKWQSYMWNKVYKKELFEGVTFPIGRQLDDDSSVMHQIFHRAEKTIYIDNEFYFYYHHEGSICLSNDDKSRARKIVDRCAARWERYVFTAEHMEYAPMLQRMKNNYVSVALAGLRFAYKHKELFNADFFMVERNRILGVDLPSSQQLPVFFSKAKKVEYALFKHCFPIYRSLVKRLGK